MAEKQKFISFLCLVLFHFFVHIKYIQVEVTIISKLILISAVLFDTFPLLTLPLCKEIVAHIAVCQSFLILLVPNTIHFKPV